MDDSDVTKAIHSLQPYLVDKILPAREIHLLGGPSGAGKTRWLLEALLAWEKGEQFLGYESFPVPWCYVASDRGIESVHRTLKTMGIAPESISIIPAFDEMLTINQILDRVLDMGKSLAVIESFASFVEPPANGFQVKHYLRAIHKALKVASMSIIGLMESPKMKPGEKYELARQRISGVAGWGHFSETVMLVEPDPDHDADKSDRILTVCGRNEAEIMFANGFKNDGHLKFTFKIEKV